MPDEKKFIFQNRDKALDRLDEIEIDLVVHPEDDQDQWNGDPAIIFSQSIAGVRHAGKIIKPVTGACLFTSTSKMGCGSFSLPAAPPSLDGSCPASNLPDNYTAHWALGEVDRRPMRRDDQICRKCYAVKNYFSYELNQLYQSARYEWIKTYTQDNAADDLAEALTEAVRAYNGNAKARAAKGESPDFFRIHDSGDLFHPSYWEAWKKVCEALPEIRFWCPTRMWLFPKWTALFQQGFPGNLTLRPSAYHFNDKAPLIGGMDNGSTGHYHGKKKGMDPVAEGIADWCCPAYAAEGACIGSIEPFQRVATHAQQEAVFRYLDSLRGEERRLTREGEGLPRLLAP